MEPEPRRLRVEGIKLHRNPQLSHETWRNETTLDLLTFLCDDLQRGYCAMQVRADEALKRDVYALGFSDGWRDSDDALTRLSECRDPSWSKQLKDRHDEILRMLQTMSTCVAGRAMIHNDNDEVRAKITQALVIIQATAEMLHNGVLSIESELKRLQMYRIFSTNGRRPEMSGVFMDSVRQYVSDFINTDRLLLCSGQDEELKPYQQLLDSVLSRMQKDRIRVRGDSIYIPFYTDEGVFTHAWRRDSDKTLTQYVWEACASTRGQANVIVMTMGGPKRIVDIIRHGNLPECPTLRATDCAFSFKNGVYFANGIHAGYSDKERPIDVTKVDTNPIFLPYGSPQIPSMLCTMNYFDCMYDAEGASDMEAFKVNYSGLLNTWSAPNDNDDACRVQPNECRSNMPTVDAVFNYQGIKGKLYLWVLIMIGRTVYLRGQHDAWDVMLFLFGQSGTGKSVMMDALRSFFDMEDVGVLSSMIEKQFGIGKIIRKRMIVGPDLRDLNMALSDFLSLVSGDPISCPQKNLDPIVATARGNVTGAGNRMPYTDVSTEVLRRFFIVNFENPVSEEAKRGDYKTLIFGEVGKLLYVSTMCYRWALKKLKEEGLENASLMNICPRLFMRTRETIESEGDMLRQFFDAVIVLPSASEKSNNAYAKRAENWTTYSQMTTRFTAFAGEQSGGGQRESWKSTAYKQRLRGWGVDCETKKHLTNKDGKDVCGTFFFCTLRKQS